MVKANASWRVASTSVTVAGMGKGILKLEDAGFDRKQVEALVDFIDTERVTKSDLNAGLEATRSDLRTEIAAVRTDLTAKIVECRSDLRMEMRTGFARVDGALSLLRWMSGSSLALSLAILVKLFVS